MHALYDTLYIIHYSLYIIQLTMTVSWMAERSDYSRVEHLAEHSVDLKDAYRDHQVQPMVIIYRAALFQ